MRKEIIKGRQFRSDPPRCGSQKQQFTFIPLVRTHDKTCLYGSNSSSNFHFQTYIVMVRRENPTSWTIEIDLRRENSHTYCKKNSDVIHIPSSPQGHVPFSGSLVDVLMLNVSPDC